jgi:hypothetical protein
MMQATDLWDGDDFALGRRFDFSRDWGVSLQGLMWPRVAIIVEVRSQNPTQMILIEDDQMIETFSADTSNSLYRTKNEPESAL